MYLRPQLSRKKTSNREILSKEHNEDVFTYNETLSVGTGFEADAREIAHLMDELLCNEVLSDEEKSPIFRKLSQILDALKREYSREVGNEQKDIEFSIQERIDEMEIAAREQGSEVYLAESTIWETNVVDKDKLVSASKELFCAYQNLLKKSKLDLEQLIQEAEAQRTRIKEHRAKR